MASPLEEFGKTAQRLSRNPLGIIALFIVLVYGIAGLILAVSSQNLASDERLPLIWFLVLFPVVVLAVFYLLVTRHHAKLYAPQDFPEAEGFFRAMTPSEQKERLDQEIRELVPETTTNEAGKIVAVEMEAGGIINGLGIRHAWVLAEELAIREIESEFGVPVQRQVAVGREHRFDGLLTVKGRLAVLDIKYTRKWHTLKAAVEHLPRTSKAIEPAQIFILAIVTDGIPLERLEVEVDRAREWLKSTDLEIELRVYDFTELKEKYGVGAGST